MMTDLPARRGLYFEEFEPGQRITSPGRTITEADIVTFAGLTGDFNSIHTDAEFSRNTPFGERVAHGLLGLSIASGLATRTGVLEQTVIAFREIGDWKFIRPVRIGDTVYARLEVKETKELRRIGGGSVVIEVSLVNQQGETTMKGNWTVLVAARPGASPA